MDYVGYIQSYIEQIEQSLDDQLGVNDIVSSVPFSKYHYQRLFHTTVGNSIAEYIKKRRLSLAAAEICATDCPIVDIAFKYGFNSHESFSRSFKEYHGVTPTECRRYSVYRTFSKLKLNKERLMMTNTAGKASKNADAIPHLLNCFIVLSKQACELIESSQAALAVPQFKVILRETTLLSDRVQQICEKLSCSDNTTESNMVMNLGNRFDALNQLKNVAFQIGVLSLNVNLLTADFQSTQDHTLDKIAEDFQTLDDMLDFRSAERNLLLNEFSDLLVRDIINVIKSEISNLADDFNLAYNQARNIFSILQQEICNELHAKRGFSTIAEEFSNVVSTLDEIRKNLSEKPKSSDTEGFSSWIGEVRQILPILSDFVTRINILAFDAELESAQITEVLEVANQLLSYTGVLCSKNQNYTVNLETVQQNINLLGLVHTYIDSQSQLGFLDQIAFRCNILAYSLKKEHARTDEGDIQKRTAISDAIHLTIKIVSEIHAVLEKQETGAADYQNQIQGLGNRLNQISDLLRQPMILQDGHSKLARITHEYNRLSNALCVNC